ncbi:hypothetical protein P154DRAFT_529443 [Amniculicola lignicola CBS 123094]|uniref:Uncharacterized protein n=1 Tax=Amniculicola lignicola CBS 123094 TaxID=1392246 RepID=A0A6A5X1P2_9PLEO|nr:hypothetical protein P154DRAFT_529443 [Amniculicola lignicola CBS 123094]
MAFWTCVYFPFLLLIVRINCNFSSAHMIRTHMVWTSDASTTNPQGLTSFDEHCRQTFTKEILIRDYALSPATITSFKFWTSTIWLSKTQTSTLTETSTTTIKVAVGEIWIPSATYTLPEFLQSDLDSSIEIKPTYQPNAPKRQTYRDHCVLTTEKTIETPAVHEYVTVLTLTTFTTDYSTFIEFATYTMISTLIIPISRNPSLKLTAATSPMIGETSNAVPPSTSTHISSTKTSIPRSPPTELIPPRKTLLGMASQSPVAASSTLAMLSSIVAPSFKVKVENVHDFAISSPQPTLHIQSTPEPISSIPLSLLDKSLVLVCPSGEEIGPGQTMLLNGHSVTFSADSKEIYVDGVNIGVHYSVTWNQEIVGGVFEIFARVFAIIVSDKTEKEVMEILTGVQDQLNNGVPLVSVSDISVSVTTFGDSYTYGTARIAVSGLGSSVVRIENSTTVTAIATTTGNIPSPMIDFFSEGGLSRHWSGRRWVEFWLLGIGHFLFMSSSRCLILSLTYSPNTSHTIILIVLPNFSRLNSQNFPTEILPEAQVALSVLRHHNSGQHAKPGERMWLPATIIPEPEEKA